MNQDFPSLGDDSFLHMEQEGANAYRTPPHSLESESAVLGSLLLDNAGWDMVSEIVREGHFYRHEHKLIWSAIASLVPVGKPADVITVYEALRARNHADECGGLPYLNQLAQYVASSSNIRRYAETVKEEAIKRKLLAATNEIADQVHNPKGKSLEQILDESEAKMLTIAEQTSKGKLGFQSTAQLAVEFLDDLAARADNPNDVTGISTGLADLDRMTTGMQGGDLIVLAARPSMGKTAFALNIGESVALDAGLPVAIFSMEMGAKQLMLRFVGSTAKVDQGKLRTGQLNDDDWTRVAEATERLRNVSLHIDETPGLTASEVRTNARRLARQCGGKLGLIVIDYLQLMSGKSEGNADNRATELGDITRSLKALAKELQCPVIALSQLNRSVEQRTDKRPMMSDLRESGAIEQDADVIMFIYRDDYYNKDSSEPNIAEIIIGKQRNGPTGTVKTFFQKNQTRFENLSTGEPLY